MTTPTIIYTHTDEAPALATYAFLPILQAFASAAGVSIETRDISLAGRVIATFPENLSPEQRIDDALADLGAMTADPAANIIKLPNISASLPQLKAVIAELQEHGFQVPAYPESPTTDEERSIKTRYDAVKGSAVNPVLREGNSDRRAPKAVKEYARANPKRLRPWSADTKTHVAHMANGDFFGNEQSVTLSTATTVHVTHEAADGTTTVLHDGIDLLEGEILDATFMSRAALESFLDESIAEARRDDVLLSLHLKATMMKVSDPIIFGIAVETYFASVFSKYAETFDRLEVDVSNGLGDLLSRLDALPEEERTAILRDLDAVLIDGAGLAMVDSDRGITNLHVPSDIIIDASMPVVIRDGGTMWNREGKPQATMALIPDRCYATVYQAVIDDCKANGALDPTTIGSIPNVGLMAQKAEEYGSHDKTFKIQTPGTVRIVDGEGTTLTEHAVESGDIWRACQAKDEPIQDWINLALKRARATGAPAVFWLDSSRAHDANVITKIESALKTLDTEGLDLHIMAPAAACTFSLGRMREGLDTISVTGNVLRDYLTDLFPILEVGTSAKMLSIVPLMKGGGLFETGAGGSAPKHVQQFEKENHLRWDSLGEYLALTASFDHLAERFDNAAARLLGQTLDEATAKYLLENKSPSRACGELDNRGSHFYVAKFWSRALADQTTNAHLATVMEPVAAALEAAEATIVEELNSAQGEPMDIGGYYQPDPVLAREAMRPSSTFNEIIDGVTVAS